MRRLLIMALPLILSSAVWAQETGQSYSPTRAIENEALPKIRFETDNYYLMKAFYPEYLQGDSVIRLDNKLIQQRIAPLYALWDSLGDSVLTAIETLSGIRWVEPGLKIHLIKFLPVPRLYEPLALPVEGVKGGTIIQAAPAGLAQFLDLIQILAGRNILQLTYPGAEQPEIAHHPLLEKGAYRFDVATMTLALAVASQVIPSDSLDSILTSDQWRMYNPGYAIYRSNFRRAWLLSPERPLITYITAEPPNSPLVQLTAPPPPTMPTPDTSVAINKVGPPTLAGGRLGMSVVKGKDGLLQVVSIDPRKLAFACGLRTGDRIRTVDGDRVTTASVLVSKILDKLGAGGTYMEVIRGGVIKGLLIRSN